MSTSFQSLRAPTTKEILDEIICESPFASDCLQFSPPLKGKDILDALESLKLSPPEEVLQIYTDDRLGTLIGIEKEGWGKDILITAGGGTQFIKDEALYEKITLLGVAFFHKNTNPTNAQVNPTEDRKNAQEGIDQIKQILRERFPNNSLDLQQASFSPTEREHLG